MAPRGHSTRKARYERFTNIASGTNNGGGSYLLAAPGHICPTTIRYPGIHVVGSSGNVVDYCVHTARDRL